MNIKTHNYYLDSNEIGGECEDRARTGEITASMNARNRKVQIMTEALRVIGRRELESQNRKVFLRNQLKSIDDIRLKQPPQIKQNPQELIIQNQRDYP